MTLKRKKERLMKQIEKESNKTLLKETKLKAKIEEHKEVKALEDRLTAVKTLDIPKEDLELVGANKESGFKSFLINKVFPAMKEAGKNWVEKSRAEKAAQRRQKKDV